MHTRARFFMFASTLVLLTLTLVLYHRSIVKTTMEDGTDDEAGVSVVTTATTVAEKKTRVTLEWGKLELKKRSTHRVSFSYGRHNLQRPR
jgi:hypothetical protein